MYKKSSGASSFSVTHIFQTNITNPTPPVTMVSSQPHTKDFLIQCQAQNNTFQCSLDQNFRDLECQQKDLTLQYVTSSISSPKLGNYYTPNIVSNLLNFVSNLLSFSKILFFR